MASDYINDRDHRIIESMEKKSANHTQVGGRHYKSSYQHWDFVNDMQLDYFEGCATKYLTRRKGNRREDLEKAKHFLEKKWELLKGNAICKKLSPAAQYLVEKFAYENNLTVPELRAIECVCERDYYRAIEVIEHIHATGAW